jgi:hypothetical protein
LTELNGGALFDAEFGIGHGATPYRKGQVLHSVFAAALIYIVKYVGTSIAKTTAVQTAQR